MRPAALSDEQAAALPVAGLTAWQALFDRGELRRGQSVLVAGAAGGVGHLAVQFAKVAGADVIGTGSGRNRDFVLGLGADVYLDYASEDPAQLQRQVDVVFDTVGGAASASLLGALSDGGVFVSIAGEPPAATEERDVRWEKLIMSRDAEQLAEIARLVAGGEVRVEIAEVMALGDVRRAHELSEAGHTRGKIVLSVGE
jgi:NADPH:quinone reductase-like Zn-dependent oxidoreductase